jgi:hypothetical protein
MSSARLWTQVPVAAGPLRGRTFALDTPDGILELPAAVHPLARRLALMPTLPVPTSPRLLAALAPLLAHGILAPQDLPLQITPATPRSLDGWRFA